MPHPRYSPERATCAQTELFASAEEAWVWAVQTHDNRIAGARNTAGFALVERPCDSRDILTVAARLYRARRLHRRHLDVMFAFARRQVPPDPRVEEERHAVDLWQDGLARLGEALHAKGFTQG